MAKASPIFARPPELRDRARFLLAICVLALFLCTPAARGLAWGLSASADEKPIGYAFAKASPLPTSDSPDQAATAKTDFEFGKAYEITQSAGESIRIRLADGSSKFVRRAYVRIVAAPRWVSTTEMFALKDRNRLRFWESAANLGDFLSGTDTANSSYDYEEYFDKAPDFSVRLPIFSTDTLELLGGAREVGIAGVLLPITREMYEKFGHLVRGDDVETDLDVALDVSDSTRDFLEKALSDLAAATRRDSFLAERSKGAKVAVFALHGNRKVASANAMPLVDLANVHWHDPSAAPTVGDSEPLVAGLAALADASGKSQEAKPLVPAGKKRRTVLVVLSGADVDESDYVSSLGRDAKLGEVHFPTEDLSAIFAQVTPEPGTSLATALRHVSGVGDTRYLPFSESLGEQTASSIVSAMRHGGGSLTEDDFKPLAEIARKARMMTFLPRKLTIKSDLPQAQAFAQDADWYTVPLWVTLDDVLLKETQ